MDATTPIISSPQNRVEEDLKLNEELNTRIEKPFVCTNYSVRILNDMLVKEEKELKRWEWLKDKQIKQTTHKEQCAVSIANGQHRIKDLKYSIELLTQKQNENK